MDDGQTVAVRCVQQTISEADRVRVRNGDERAHNTGLDIDTADLFVSPTNTREASGVQASANGFQTPSMMIER
jgi:hypothetical protein